jgi:hypothetical protein
MSNHIEDLKAIRQIMEKSSKFLSLSGKSGIAIGITALVASLYVYNATGHFSLAESQGPSQDIQLLLIALLTLVVSLSFGLVFTFNKTKTRKEKLWTKQSKKLLVNLAVPLLIGAIACGAFIYHETIWPISSLTLIFYGVALVNGANYTFKDIYFLGLIEISLGLLSLFFIEYALLFWGMGFGIMHILYGAIMYTKYEK